MQARRQAAKSCIFPLPHCHGVSLADGGGSDRVHLFFVVVRTKAAFGSEALGWSV